MNDEFPNPYHGTTFINIYLVDRAYGGLEEGGWWFDYGVFETGAAYPSHHKKDIDLIRDEFQKWCDAENDKRNSNIGNTNSEGRYVVYVEENPGADWPTMQPRYE